MCLGSCTQIYTTCMLTLLALKLLRRFRLKKACKFGEHEYFSGSFCYSWLTPVRRCLTPCDPGSCSWRSCCVWEESGVSGWAASRCALPGHTLGRPLVCFPTQSSSTLCPEGARSVPTVGHLTYLNGVARKPEKFCKQWIRFSLRGHGASVT